MRFDFRAIFAVVALAVMLVVLVGDTADESGCDRL